MSLIDEIYERIGDKVETAFYKKSDSEIARFFAGQTLFITGTTGFLGKCILEKLLRSCSDIKRIYILMRENKKYSFDERMERYFENVVFSRLREENPNFQSKVTVVKGDLSDDNLGLSNEDKSTIVNNVTVMYHNAANVNFIARASSSLRTNVLGTLKMLDLARECKKLKVFVYVSTAYSHLYKKDIHEEYYPSPADLQTVYDTIEADEKTEKGLSETELQTLIGKFPNIYPYSKAIAEDLVRQCAKNAEFAVAIYRPSVVISAMKEPLAGWCGNASSMVVLLFLATTLGFFRVFYHFHYPVDVIPCDMTVNALLVITRHAHVQWSEYQRRELVYNYGSSTTNPVYFRMIQDFYGQTPPIEFSTKAVAFGTTMTMTTRLWEFYLWHWTCHFIPALFVDFGLLVFGRKPMVLSIFWRATRNMDKIHYFSNGNWRIHMPTTLEVIDKMNPADREIFYCDIREPTLQEHTWITWRGLKRYVLKEEITSEAGRNRYYLLCCIHYGFRVMWFLAFSYILFKLSSVIF